jgi:hypothetical protein
MRPFSRILVGAFGIVCLAAAIAMSSTSGALAQTSNQMAPGAGAPPAIKQMALTDKQIGAVIAAQKEMNVITAKLSPTAQPDAKTMAQLEAVAKKNGFSSFDDYSNMVGNISLVLGGFDPATKKYIGADAAIKQQIAEVKADTKMSAQDKKEALAGLNQALNSPEPPIAAPGIASPAVFRARTAKRPEADGSHQR